MNNTELREFLGTSQELYVFWLSFLLGAFLGGAYDIFRGVRRAVVHRAVLVLIEDTVFAFAFVFAHFVFCTQMLGGALRLYPLLAQTLGFFGYCLIIGRFSSDAIAISIITFVKIIKKTASRLFSVPFLKK